MWSTTIMAFIHHLFAFILFALIVFQHLALKTDLTAAEAKRIMRIDALLGITAISLLLFGLLRVFYFEKGASYYMHNPYFHAKFALYILACILSIFPTIKFLKWRMPLREGKAPELSSRDVKKILMCMRGELLCLVLIIFCAAAIARGV